MFKRILLLMLLLPVVTFAQFKIGSVSLRDSSGTLVVTAPLKTNTVDQWISRTWLPELVLSTNSGLRWSATTGLTLKLGIGLTVQNDTLKYNGSSVVAVDDSTINWVGGKLKVKYNEGITSDIYGIGLNLSTNSGLTYDGLGKLIINSDSGVSITGNKLKLKLDNTNLEFNGSGSLQLKANSITESQISKNLNLDSLKIGNLPMNISDGKINMGDSIAIGNFTFTGDRIISQSGFNMWFDGSHYALWLNGDYYISDTSALGFKFGTISTLGKNLTTRDGIFSGRIQGAKGTDVASDTLITLGAGNYFVVTGTASISRISSIGWQSGSIVTLKFDAGAGIRHMNTTYDTSCEVYLSGAGNFTASANDVITFILDGTIWRELSRTDN